MFNPFINELTKDFNTSACINNSITTPIAIMKKIRSHAENAPATNEPTISPIPYIPSSEIYQFS